jgi:hypothetical protein
MIMTKPPNHNWNSVFCFLSSSLFSQMAPHSTKRRWVGGWEGWRDGGRSGNVSTRKPTHVHSKIGAIHHPPHSSSNNQPAPRQHRIIHTAGRPWQPWRAQEAIRSRVGGSRSSGGFCELEQGMKTGTQAERGTPRGPSRPTSKPASTNSLARSLTVSTGENK